MAAFRPGGPYALLLAERPVVLVLDGNVFVHGGVLPMHLDYGLDRLNGEVRAWLLGEGEPPEFIHTGKSPTWTRDYSDEVDADDCCSWRKCCSGWAPSAWSWATPSRRTGSAPFARAGLVHRLGNVRVLRRPDRGAGDRRGRDQDSSLDQVPQEMTT